MNNNFIPPIDIQNELQASTTITATTNGPSLDLGAGFLAQGPGQLMALILSITAMDETSGNETYSFQFQESPDNTNWTNCGAPLNLSAAAASVVQAYSVWGLVSQRYIRCVATLGGTTPSVTFTTDLGQLGGIV